MITGSDGLFPDTKCIKELIEKGTTSNTSSNATGMIKVKLKPDSDSLLRIMPPTVFS
jgi:hypothetical protein